MKLLSTLLVLFLCFQVSHAQTSKDVTVPLTASIAAGPTSITLSWPNPGSAGLLIRRRTKGQGGTAWQQIINLANSNLTTLTDNNVTNGQVYEYMIQRTINNLNAYGYAHVAIQAKPIDSRGKILIFVDSTTADALGVELARLKNDLRGDGWWPIPFHTGPSSTVQSIKNQISTSYTADPGNVKAVLLLGTVPIPYSGNTAWDGHGDHQGAWPSDAYYADVNGNWTDSTVNNISPGRAVNKNIPFDGKFDQSYLPSIVELQVGRVDFRHINAAAFGEADQIGLMRRYLDKNHKWRIGDFSIQNKALVDDNFGYFSGEAFGSSGYRNAYPLVGEANIVETDFFEGTESQSYLLGYGCGGGNYNGAGGVGSSSNFATDTVNIVFSNLFGSYFGDWDYENDPFMPSALASRGGILTCSWAGRPHGFNQGLASGETIGFCIRETMNAQYNIGFANAFGKGGAHVALLGDPTLRAHVLKPVSDLTLTNLNCKKVELNWTGSTDSVDGYHVYRAPSQDGPYTRLTTVLTTSTNFIDNSPIPGNLFYQVRAIKNVSAPGGGVYANNSIGAIKFIEFVPSSMMAWFDVSFIDCNGASEFCGSVTGGGVLPFSYLWSNGSTDSCTLYTLPSLVNLTITDALGCSAETGEFNVTTTPISLSASVINESAPNTNDGAVNLSIVGGLPPYQYLWSNGGITQNLSGLSGGTYTVTIADANGCTETLSVTITTTSSITEAATFQHFLLSPNPSNGMATLSLKLHQSAALRVEIRDWTGRLILGNPTVQTDILSIPIDLTLSPAGMYTVTVWVGSQVFVRKLTVVRT
jgi:hypothetical protein